MKATINHTFSDVDLDESCENCDKVLDGGVQLWKIDDDDSRGWFCSEDCAQHHIMLAEIDDLYASDEEKEALREINHVEGLQTTDAEAALDWFRDDHSRHTFTIAHCSECRYFDIGDAWTLTASAAAIKDAGYEPNAHLALFWNAGADDVLIFEDGTIEEVANWMRDNAEMHSHVNYFVIPTKQCKKYLDTHAVDEDWHNQEEE